MNPGSLQFCPVITGQWTNTAQGKASKPLDPELLSNLFERLIASTEEGWRRVAPAPTPGHLLHTGRRDVDKMVKDALSAAVKDHAGELTDNQLLELFGDSDVPLPELPMTAKNRLANQYTGTSQFLTQRSALGHVPLRYAPRHSQVIGEAGAQSDESAEDIIRAATTWAGHQSFGCADCPAEVVHCDCCGNRRAITWRDCPPMTKPSQIWRLS